MYLDYLECYLQRIEARGNSQLAASVRNTATDIDAQYLQAFSFCDHEIACLFGNIQSGKTAQMFGVICAATNAGFPVFLVMTTDNVLLQEQTLDRVKDDLPEFCICGEYDTEIFVQNALTKPCIIVIKKNHIVLRQWSIVLGNTGFMKGNPVFIIDDEADAASLNTLVNKNRQSTINKHIDSIKSQASSSIYLQVTGTPQALFLQSQVSGFRPNFVYYFKPGKDYLGGDFFFPNSLKTPPCVSLIDSMKEPLRDALIHHLIASVTLFGQGKKVCTFLIHPSVRVASHRTHQGQVYKMLQAFLANSNDPKQQSVFKAVYDDMNSQSPNLDIFPTVYSQIMKLIPSVKVLVLNSKNVTNSVDYDQGSCIVIGGNTLGRGVTFSGLQTIYYTRNAKKPQADTVWQHSRMFGYDRQASLMRVYIEAHLYKLFSDINTQNNSLIAQVVGMKSTGFSNVKIYLPEGVLPTRKAVIDADKLLLITGGTNYYPFDPDNDDIAELDTLLASFDELTPTYQVGIGLMEEILEHIISNGSDFIVKNYISAMEAMRKENPIAQGVLIVRRNRDVAKGTGALLSPNDWQLGKDNGSKIVLTLYKMKGTKGWNGRQIWVPNIRFPDGMVYYDTI